MKPLISFSDFDKLDLRVGEILHAERKEGSDKLLRLRVNFGDEGERTILSGIYPFYEPETLIGKTFIFILNLEPRKIMGEESQGMILAADAKIPLPLKPLKKAPAGAKIR